MLKRTLVRCLSTAALAAAVVFPGSVHAQQVLPMAEFVEIPGQQEFSGRLIARPIQPAEAEARRMTTGMRAVMHAVAQQEMLSLGIERHFPEVDEYILVVPMGQTENAVAARLMATGAFEYVHPDWILYPASCPNDPQFGQQWHHAANRLQSCAAWAIETGSPSIIVAIVDTGIRTSHQDLQQHRYQGYHVPTQRWESQGGPVNDINGHGTAVTGAAAANGNNGIGVSGVGWNIGHRMYRVTDSSGGGASLSNLTFAARLAADVGDRVVNVSYSGVNNSSVFTTGTYVRSKGSLLVWAAGNANANLNGNREDNVIVVGATDQNDNKASFSNFGPLVDLVAPGVSIRTTSNGGNASYTNANGTSFASPIVAGLAALIWSRNPDLTPWEVEDILRGTCLDLGTPGIDNIFGYGRIRSGAALAATPDSNQEPGPPAAPTGLSATAFDGRVDLSWNANNEPNIAGYFVFRSAAGGPFSPLNTTPLTGTSYSDTGLPNGFTFSYYVVAINQDGLLSDPSSTVSATPFASDPPPVGAIFSDGFESGNLTAGGWNRQNGHAYTSQSAAFEGSWGAQLRRSTWIERSVSTVGFNNIQVSYARRTLNLAAGQWLFVEWWNGSSWNAIETIQSPAWQTVSFQLPAAASNNSAFRLRFRLNSNNNARIADIDSVEVSGDPTN